MPIVEKNCVFKFLPQNEPAICEVKTIISSERAYNLVAVLYEASAKSCKFSSPSKSGLPISPTNKKSPVNKPFSLLFSLKRKLIQNGVCPGVFSMDILIFFTQI